MRAEKIVDELRPDGRVAVVGLGYVGLPLATALAAAGVTVIGYDTDDSRIAELSNGQIELLGPLESSRLVDARLTLTSDVSQMKGCATFIVAVQTPLTAQAAPDLSALLAACEDVAAMLSAGALVVIESTVYPGVTRTKCLPVLQRHGFHCGRDFYLAYAPERISPGDPPEVIGGIRRIVGGYDEVSLNRAIGLYGRIVSTDIYPAASIEIAEMAKVVENGQRDVNIAFVNEVAKACQALGLDSGEVLDACATKWNFHRYKPGLVGGHCIAVDPYYLHYIAAVNGVDMGVGSEARSLNDSMAQYVADRVLALTSNVSGPRVGVLGFSYKGGVGDIRHTGVASMIRRLSDCGAWVQAYDPLVDKAAAKDMYGVALAQVDDELANLDALVVAVAHPQFDDDMLERCASRVKREGVIVDITGTAPQAVLEQRRSWRL